MRIIADTHCHTIASTHAYSTILENLKQASARGLSALAITDHANSLPGSPGEFYFDNLRVIPKKLEGVYLLRGIEANVVDYDGSIDVPEELFSRLNWVIASMHCPTIRQPRDEDECTNAWLQVAKNPFVNVIGHCGSECYKFDYERVIPEFGKNNKLVEINNSSFKIRKDSVPNCKRIALACKKYGVSVVVNSDAHFCTQVGVFNDALDMLKEINFPENLIINADKERFEKYLMDSTNFFKS